ncbi:MAG TPA: small ribosomal subunit biogenesis GTPase RsgA [Elainellaceae cyanobacterium]
MNEASLHLPFENYSTINSELLGTVIAVQANYYWVQLDSGSPVPDDVKQPESDSVSLLCTRRARLKKIGQHVIVGDQVTVEEPDWMGGRGAISHVLPRKTELDRPPIANANQILLVFALAEPGLEPIQLSRFLVKAESTGLSVALCLNKSDLAPVDEQKTWCDRLNQWGYYPLIISVASCQGLARLRHELSHRIVVVSGPSGVGKSSLINQLIPKVDLRVGEVSGKLGRGRHTTRHVELFELPTGGLLADTPGFNQPDLDCTPTELANFFPEIRHRIAQANCQFSNCLHRDEPNCVVRGDWERYEHYLSFLDEAIARQTALESSGNAESTLKVKTGEHGKSQYEPKLETKKYRRPSRRSQRQALHDLYKDIDEVLQNNDGNLLDDLQDE